MQCVVFFLLLSWITSAVGKPDLDTASNEANDEPIFPVLLDNCGPDVKPMPPVHGPPIVLPVRHEPLQVLPHPPIPQPKIIDHKIVHYQTVLKPRVYQRIVTVPRLVHYIRKSVKPVIEHIPYTAKPILGSNEIPRLISNELPQFLPKKRFRIVTRKRKLSALEDE